MRARRHHQPGSIFTRSTTRSSTINSVLTLISCYHHRATPQLPISVIIILIIRVPLMLIATPIHTRQLISSTHNTNSTTSTSRSSCSRISGHHHRLARRSHPVLIPRLFHTINSDCSRRPSISTPTKSALTVCAPLSLVLASFRSLSVLTCVLLMYR